METVDRYVFGPASRHCAVAKRIFSFWTNISGRASLGSRSLVHQCRSIEVCIPLSESKIALVYGQVNEPPSGWLRVALPGLAIREYFREEKHQEVLLFLDNIFRFSQAGSEVSALLARRRT